MSFVVSARKYRPMRFDEVVGQEHVSQTLKNAFKNDHLAHAFLFCGPRGVGKTTSARILAKVLNCENVTEDFEPCNECGSCQSFNSNASFNITELDAASNNSVEHIRALIEQVRFQPQQGKFKIYIIDEVHMLSQQAFNAFLKTLEEPPSYAKFILATTEKHKIIPTILSRCQIFDFKRIQIPEMVMHLQTICAEENIKAEKDALHIIAQKADGALRDALSIFDRIVSFSNDNITYDDVITNLNVLDYDYYFQLLDSMFAEDVSSVLLTFDEILRKGFDPSVFINGFAEHIRNILVSKDTQTLELLEVGDALKSKYKQQAQIAPMAFLLAALNIANDCDVNYKMARNKRLHVEMAIIKMTYLNRAAKASAQTVVVANENIEKKKSPNHNSIKATPVVKEKQAAYSSPTPPNTNHHTPLKKEETVKLGSLSAIEALVAQEEAKEQEIETLPFNQENLTQLWNEYIENIESQSTKAAFKSSKFHIEGEYIIINATSAFTQSTVKEEFDFLPFLKEKFRLKNLFLTVQVDKAVKKEQEEQQKKLQKAKPLSDREKFILMSKGNPLLYELQKKFDLRPEK
jgi:DNA polymerase-3 subunit gamma/tau